MIHTRLTIATLLILSLLLVAALAACGEAATPEPEPTQPPAPTAAPEPTAVPTEAPAAQEEPTEVMEETTDGDPALMAYAADKAGGPGAIYVGDINQMAGPAPLTPSGEPDSDLGDSEGNVPLSALQDHLWLYESEYYQSLIERANLANPTELTSSGESISVQHACINRALLPCKIIEQYWAPNLEARTNGQLVLEVSSFPELGLAGPDTLQLVSDGTLGWRTSTPATWLARCPPSRSSPCGASTPTGRRCTTR